MRGCPTCARFASSRDFRFACPRWPLYTPEGSRALETLVRHSIVPLQRPSAQLGRLCHPLTFLPFRAFRRHRSRRVSLLRQAGCAARAASVCRHRQRPDPPQHVAEQPPGQMPFRQQEPVVLGVLHQPAAGFHQPLLETRERPAFDPRRQDQSAPRGCPGCTPVYCPRVLGQWFDGIRFYAAASSPRRSRRTWAGLR